MFDILYRATLRAASRGRAMWVLFGVSFAESAVLPLPIDAVTIPIMLAQPERVWLVAWVAALASALGGAVGYGLGYFFYETLGLRLVEFYGLESQIRAFNAYFQEYGWLVVMVGGITPIPYKVTTIACGLAHLSFWNFLLFSIISRLIRFLSISAMFRVWGPSIHRFMDRNSNLMGAAMLLVLAGGFASVYCFR